MGAPLSVENSTDSANEAAQSGLRPGHPCGVPPDKPAPPPAKWLAYGQAAYQGRGHGRAGASSTARTPHRAPQQLKDPKNRFSRKSGLPRPVPNLERRRWPASRRLNAKREGRQRRPSSKLASLATSDDDGRRRGSPIVRNDDAGPRQGTAPKLSRSAQDARNRVRTGKGAARPRKRLYELPTPFSPPTCSRPGAGRGRPRSVSGGFVKFPVVACVL